MKREDLKKLLGDAATDEVLDKIMGLNGTDIETHKTNLANLTKQLETAQGQITEANKQIESFKNMKPEELQKAADDYKAKWEQAQKDAADQLAAVKFDHALESALTGAKVKNIKTVRPLLSMDKLKLKDDGTVDGLEDQLTEIKKTNDYLFEPEKATPKIVASSNNQPVITDAFEAAMWKGSGLKPPGTQQS